MMVTMMPSTAMESEEKEMNMKQIYWEFRIKHVYPIFKF